MAKKSVWIDNTVPPTNYIWVKTNEYGEIIGVFQHDGKVWVRLAISGESSDIEGDGTISAVTLSGESVDIHYSIDPIAHTLVVRTDKGTILSNEPDGSDVREVVTVGLISWKDI